MKRNKANSSSMTTICGGRKLNATDDDAKSTFLFRLLRALNVHQFSCCVFFVLKWCAFEYRVKREKQIADRNIKIF